MRLLALGVAMVVSVAAPVALAQNQIVEVGAQHHPVVNFQGHILYRDIPAPESSGFIVWRENWILPPIVVDGGIPIGPPLVIFGDSDRDAILGVDREWSLLSQQHRFWFGVTPRRSWFSGALRSSCGLATSTWWCRNGAGLCQAGGIDGPTPAFRRGRRLRLAPSLAPSNDGVVRVPNGTVGRRRCARRCRPNLR